MDDKIANAAKLIVGVASVSVDPTGLAAAGLVADGYLGLKEIFKPSSATAKTLITRVERDLKTRLEHPNFHMPVDGPTLLPQMIELTFLTPSEIAPIELANTDPSEKTSRLLEVMLGKLPREYQDAALCEAFCNLLRPIYTSLFADDRFAQTHGPAIARETYAQLRQIAQTTTATDLNVQTLLSQLSGMTKPELETLARRFGHQSPEATGLGTLKTYLHDKATDLQRLEAEVEALRGVSERIDNVLGAVTDAIRNTRLDKARELLNAARDIQRDLLRKPLEANAKLEEKLAELDLIEGKVDSAFAHLSAAADSFAAIDPVEPARRRVGYGAKLYQHGLRYGGPGLALSARMWAQARDALSQTEQPELWTNVQNDLGAALSQQGTRTGGAEGAGLLGQAVAAYGAALEVWTRDAHPVQWAGTHNNLGTALSDQGTRTGGAEGAALLGQAVAAYSAALEVRTRDAHPVHWAMTQNNLGSVLQDQGIRSGGAEAAGLLAQAVAVYYAALEVRTRDAHPVQWGETQINMANAEKDWVATGVCLDPAAHWRAALGSVEAALTVFDPEHMAYNHGKAAALREEILAGLAGAAGGE